MLDADAYSILFKLDDFLRTCLTCGSIDCGSGGRDCVSEFLWRHNVITLLCGCGEDDAAKTKQGCGGTLDTGFGWEEGGRGSEGNRSTWTRRSAWCWERVGSISGRPLFHKDTLASAPTFRANGYRSFFLLCQLPISARLKTASLGCNEIRRKTREGSHSCVGMDWVMLLIPVATAALPPFDIINNSRPRQIWYATRGQTAPSLTPSLQALSTPSQSPRRDVVHGCHHSPAIRQTEYPPSRFHYALSLWGTDNWLG